MLLYLMILVALAAATSPIPALLPTNDRATLLQRQIDAAIKSGKPATIELSGTYNFSRASLTIDGARDLKLQPAADCVAPRCVPLMLFTLWPCGDSLGQNAAQCRPVDFNNPTVRHTCKAANGKPCACPDVIWSSGVNISRSTNVTVIGVTIDYSPRSLPPMACKPGPVPPPPPPGPTAQFNSGRKFSYHIFNSSRVVTEDLTIRSAPFMAITSFLGDGGHVFRRVSFTPNPQDFNAMIAGKDGLHESDVRTGLRFLDSRIHGTADDFFNFHNTLQIVFRCDAASRTCLIASPHINAVPLNTVYGSQRVLTTVRAGDRFSFYPLTHETHPENSVPPCLATLTVASKRAVSDAATLKQARLWAQKTATDKTNGLMAFGDGSDLWNISFAGADVVTFSKLVPNTLANIDSISGAGAEIRGCDFSVTACNLGRTKSSDSIIANTTFSKAKSRNLEVTGLQIWFEGPLRINNVSIIDNTFVDEGPKGSLVHVSKAATNVRQSGNRYITSATRAHSHLTIDPSVVEFSRGLEVSLGPVTKDSANPLFGEDKPWEAAWWNTYPTVAYDAATSKYKMWYNSNIDCSCKRGVPVPCSASNTSNPGMCPHLGYNVTGNPRVFGEHLVYGAITAVMFAESTDGLSWAKPSLGLVSFRGSTANNMVLVDPGIHSGAGVFLDAHETNASRRFKMFGVFSEGAVPHSQTGMGTIVSADGVHWGGWESAASMLVTADTANNAVWDPHLNAYIAFSRNWCRSASCNETAWGARRETRSTSDRWGGNWSRAVEALHGESGYEMYSLVPFRAPNWTPGLYLAIGSFYATTDPEGHVYCELCRSTDYGVTWQRLAPHKQYIPLGDHGAFDSHTCYAAPPILDPNDDTKVMLYYAGGNGPHSGGGSEHGRADFIALAHAHVESLAGMRPVTSRGGVAVGTLRTSPVIVSGSKLVLRIRTERAHREPSSNRAAVTDMVHVRVLPTHDGDDVDRVLGHTSLQGWVRFEHHDVADTDDQSSEAEVQWDTGSDTLVTFRGRRVRLEMIIHGSVTLFSFGFQ